MAGTFVHRKPLTLSGRLICMRLVIVCAFPPAPIDHPCRPPSPHPCPAAPHPPAPSPGGHRFDLRAESELRFEAGPDKVFTLTLLRYVMSTRPHSSSCTPFVIDRWMDTPTPHPTPQRLGRNLRGGARAGQDVRVYGRQAGLLHLVRRGGGDVGGGGGASFFASSVHLLSPFLHLYMHCGIGGWV